MRINTALASDGHKHKDTSWQPSAVSKRSSLPQLPKLPSMSDCANNERATSLSNPDANSRSQSVDSHKGNLYNDFAGNASSAIAW